MKKLNLLDFNICPADISKDVQSQIDAIAEKFISAIFANSAGLFAIELFLDKNGKVWVNETAQDCTILVIKRKKETRILSLNNFIEL